MPSDREIEAVLEALHEHGWHNLSPELQDAVIDAGWHPGRLGGCGRRIGRYRVGYCGADGVCLECWSRRVSDLSAAATARPDCREVVAELVAALDAFCRMPDAMLKADDPRFEWWYETAEVRKRAREAAKRFEWTLGEGSGEAGR